MLRTMPASSNARPTAPVAAVIGIVVEAGRVLLVRRAKAPDQGLWGYPGGRIELGETISAAVERELREETGLRVSAGPVITVLDSLHHDADGALSHHYLMIAVRCAWVSGTPLAADDALDARWFDAADLPAMQAEMSARVLDLLEMVRPPEPPNEPPGSPRTAP